VQQEREKGEASSRDGTGFDGTGTRLGAVGLTTKLGSVGGLQGGKSIKADNIDTKKKKKQQEVQTVQATKPSRQKKGATI